MLVKIPTGTLSKMVTKCPTASPKRPAILITPINKLVGVILLVDPQKKPIKKLFLETISHSKKSQHGSIRVFTTVQNC